MSPGYDTQELLNRSKSWTDRTPLELALTAMIVHRLQTALGVIDTQSGHGVALSDLIQARAVDTGSEADGQIWANFGLSAWRYAT